MLKINLEQAYRMAGVYTSDSDFERDVKFMHWIAGRKYVVTSSSDTGVADDVEILIIKES